MADSAQISTLAEAQEFYRQNLQGSRLVEVGGKRITVNFEKGATHLYSESVSPEGFALLPQDQRVSRRLPGGRWDHRRFSLERARHMGKVLPTIERFVFSIAGTASHGAEKRMLHGPCEGSTALRVVLRPQDERTCTCVSAYPITKGEWLKAKGARAIKFP